MPSGYLGWIKGPLWLAVFFVDVWTFLALMREAQTALDFLIPRLEHAWRWMAERADKSQRAWKIAGLLCAAVIVAITLYRVWPVWHFKATSSLREDEIISIVKYTSRGFVPASAPTAVLGARGYGLIFLFAMLSCVAFAEWLRTRRKVWLNLLAVLCVLGTYTLPFYVVFAGGLLLLAFLYRPSRETFLAGLVSLAAILMLYLPIFGKVCGFHGIQGPLQKYVQLPL